jgi:hypothetical protein
VVVELPDLKAKGRVIGYKGATIRAFVNTAGVRAWIPNK